MSDALATEQVTLPSHLRRLVMAAKAWAAFQEEDSKLDQQDDIQLHAAAHTARLSLIDAIEALP